MVPTQTLLSVTLISAASSNFQPANALSCNSLGPFD